MTTKELEEMNRQTTEVENALTEAPDAMGIEIEQLDPGIGVGWFMVTPEIAQAWLGHNQDNRRLSPDRGRLFARTIIDKEWDLNGETIKIDKAGNLLDGQHRLDGIRRSGIAVPCLIVWGLDPSVQITVDLTRARSIRDALRMMGVPFYTPVAATINALQAYRDGAPGSRSHRRTTVKAGLRLFEQEPGILESARTAMRLQTGGLRVPVGAMAALHYVFYDLNAEDADDFYEKLGIGADLSESDPIFKLRRVLEDHSSTERRRMTPRTMLALTIKAWNAYRNNEQPRLLSFKPGGKSPEAFPIPV